MQAVHYTYGLGAGSIASPNPVSVDR